MGRKHYGEIASPFLGPYLSNTQLLDTQYGIRREGDNFKIGSSTVTMDNMSNITIKGKQFKGTEGLWKLLTRKNVNYNSLDKNDLQSYKTILEITNGHLEGYKAGVGVGGATFRLLAERSSKTLSRNYFPRLKLQYGKSG